jgi:PPM family protein phosphatase
VIPVEQAHVHIAAASHPGMRGKNNEDRYRVSTFRMAAEDGAPSVLAVVSDGIGGHRAGEVAAQMAVDIITQVVTESQPGDPVHILRDSIIQASEAIQNQAQSDLQKKGMGATCACAWIIGSRLYAASVGDSRIYLVRGEKIIKLSIDHTWVQEAIEFGLLEPDEARSHPNAHIIRRYLGSQQTVVPDLRLRIKPDETDEQSLNNQGLRLVSNDYLLLCSDGLTDLVDDAEILAGLKTRSLDLAVESLVELANERGGHDNITIIAMHMPRRIPAAAAAPSAPTREARSPSRRSYLPVTLSCAGLGVLAALLALAGGLFWFYFQPSSTPTQTPTHEPFPTMTPTAGMETPGLPVVPLTPPVQQRTPQIPRGTPDPSRPTYTPWPTSTPQPTSPPIINTPPAPTA